MTRSRRVAKRLVPEDAAVLAAHLQDQLEAEKARIARRLHGDVAGMLAAARMDLSRLAARVAEERELREHVLRVDQILEAVIHNARTEMQRLHPALLDHFGLSAAVRSLVEETCRAAGAEYTLDLPEFADGVSPPVALAVYRVIESLPRHRALRRLNVRLRDMNSSLLLCIEVDAVGTRATDIQRDLLALRAWLETLGATWTETSRGDMDTIELNLPRREMAATATPDN